MLIFEKEGTGPRFVPSSPDGPPPPEPRFAPSSPDRPPPDQSSTAPVEADDDDAEVMRMLAIRAIAVDIAGSEALWEELDEGQAQELLEEAALIYGGGGGGGGGG